MKKLIGLIVATIFLTACTNGVASNEVTQETEQTTEVTQGTETVIEEKDMQLMKEYEACFNYLKETNYSDGIVDGSKIQLEYKYTLSGDLYVELYKGPADERDLGVDLRLHLFYDGDLDDGKKSEISLDKSYLNADDPTINASFSDGKFVVDKETLEIEFEER